jgi:hypothetical protein
MRDSSPRPDSKESAHTDFSHGLQDFARGTNVIFARGATDPTRQNSGLGKILLSAAEQWVRERGGKRTRMNVVNVRDALIAWYLRRGYAKTGETERFPYGDDRFGAPLRNDLSFLVLARTSNTIAFPGEKRQKRVGMRSIARVCRRRHTPPYCAARAESWSLPRLLRTAGASIQVHAGRGIEGCAWG